MNDLVRCLAEIGLGNTRFRQELADHTPRCGCARTLGTVSGGVVDGTPAFFVNGSVMTVRGTSTR